MPELRTSPTPPTVSTSRLRCFDLLAPLSAKEIAAIARCLREAVYPAGSIVVHQGEIAKDLYFIEDGAVNIYREKLGQLQRVALIESPGVFGEMALINRERIRTATVRAATDVHLYLLSYTDMTAALRQMSPLREGLRVLLHERGLPADLCSSTADALSNAATQNDASITAKIAALCR